MYYFIYTVCGCITVFTAVYYNELVEQKRFSVMGHAHSTGSHRKQ